MADLLEATAKDVAQAEGVAPQAVYRWITRGLVAVRRLPGARGRVRIYVDDKGHPLTPEYVAELAKAA